MSIKRILDQVQNETWAQLYSRLIMNACSSKSILSEELFDFLFNSASSHGTNTGYILASLLTTVNFILSKHKSFIEIRDGYVINLNTLSSPEGITLHLFFHS